MLQVVNRQLERLGLLVGELLDVSRITSGRFTLRPEEVDLAAVVRDVTDRFSEQIQTSGCTLHVESEGPVVGAWDRLRIEQVV
jgi:signal transduction histidine kinase